MENKEANLFAFRHEGVTYYASEQTFVVTSQEGEKALIFFARGMEDMGPYDKKSPWWQIGIGELGSGHAKWISHVMYDEDEAHTMLEELVVEEQWAEFKNG